MADSLPSINFGFEDLRNRMAHFTAKFDAFIERGRKQVLEERNQFRINLAESQGVHNSVNSYFVYMSYVLTKKARGPTDETERY